MTETGFPTLQHAVMMSPPKGQHEQHGKKKAEKRVDVEAEARREANELCDQLLVIRASNARRDAEIAQLKTQLAAAQGADYLKVKASCRKHGHINGLYHLAKFDSNGTPLFQHADNKGIVWVYKDIDSCWRIAHEEAMIQCLAGSAGYNILSSVWSCI